VVHVIPDLEALDFLAVEIREVALTLSSDWPQIFTPDELTARLSSELIDTEGADDLAHVEPRSSRMMLLLRLGRMIIDREVQDFEHYTGDVLTPVTKRPLGVS